MADKTKVWYAVDEDGEEFLYMERPQRRVDYWGTDGALYLSVKNGTIKKETGKEITWADEPIECIVSDLKALNQ